MDESRDLAETVAYAAFVLAQLQGEDMCRAALGLAEGRELARQARTAGQPLREQVVAVLEAFHQARAAVDFRAPGLMLAAAEARLAQPEGLDEAARITAMVEELTARLAAFTPAPGTRN
jgi:hypothetical protein